MITNGSPSIGAIVEGTGSVTPTNYNVIINSGVQLGRLVKRTDPVAMPSVSAPPASTGTRSVSITAAGQSAGDFATLRDLTLNGNVGIYSVPPGTYRNFIANGGTGLSLGVAGSTEPSVYNFATLILNGSSQIQVVGPVVVTIGSGLTINASVGSSPNPLWLVLRVASGGVTLNGGSFLNGVVVAPTGTVIINGNTTLKGSVFCDRLTVNGGGVLQAFGDSGAPAVTIDSPCQNAVTTLAQIGVSGAYTDSTPTTVKVNGSAATQNASNFNSTVTLSDGPNTITVLATDLFNNTAQATRNVTRVTGPNQAPTVNAGPDLLVTLPGTATLNGSVADDGLPTCVAPVNTWAKVSGPGNVAFANASSASTTASFSAPGVYVLRLLSSDSSLSSSDDVTVSAFPPNQPPVVGAGANQTIELPAPATLNGSVNDDGLPPGSVLTVAWSKISGPGTVSFTSPGLPVTHASFSLPGTYVLQLSANDTQYTVTSGVTVVVKPENHAPQVNAGPDKTIELPANSVTLNGTVTDDGLPEGSTLTISWSKVSGPGAVTFSAPTQAVTNAAFVDPGTYVLRLSASDTRFTVTSDVTVTVVPENYAPQVNAGPDLTITLPGSATLNGAATDDGLPPGSTLTITWSKVSGPGLLRSPMPLRRKRLRLSARLVLMCFG